MTSSDILCRLVAIFIIRMKFHKNKLLTTVSAIALVLAVGACSSSSDDEMMMTDAAANGGDAATNGGDAATNGGDDTKTPAQTLAAAQADYDTLPDDATDDVRAAAMTALVAALMLEGNEADYLAYLEKKVADQAQAIKDEAAATAAKEASDKAAEVLKALETLVMTGPTPTVSASSGGDLTAKAAGYKMSTTTPEAISGFRGAILTKDRAEARVYTNIEDSVATLMDGLGLYSATSAPGKPKTYTVGDDAAGNINVPWTKVTRPDNNEEIDRSGALPVTTFAGSVTGLAGVFSCTGADCMAPARETNGSVPEATAATGWKFAPTDPNGTIDVPDDDGYVQFGWWLNMKGKDLEDGFEVQTFASATDYAVIDTALKGETVTGSATYTGGAAGKWAIASTTEDTTDGGHFTATATLGVDFDVNTAAENETANKMGVSVSGMITDFMTGDVSRPNWKVTLTLDNNAEAPGVQPDDELPAMVAGTTKWTTGGAVDGTGDWTGNFHGSEKVTTHPMAVVGTFDAAIASGDVGWIRGAYGATK